MPIVVTGFEPLDMLEGIRRAVVQLEIGQHVRRERLHARGDREGNLHAMALLERGLRGDRPDLAGHRHHPAERLASCESVRRLTTRSAVLDVERHPRPTSRPCAARERCSRGPIKPHQCSAFGKECTPRKPLGATMVSGEGRLRGVFQLSSAGTR